MKSKNSQTQDYIKLLPVGLILAIIPIIVYMKVVDLDESVSKFWNGSKQYYDFFSYYKMIWFITFTITAVIFLLYYLSTKKIKLSFPKIFIPLSLYAGFVFLSASFSKYHYPSFFGFADRFEGFFTILCYVIICFVSYSLISSKNDYKYLFGFLSAAIIIISMIGLFQFFGFDFFQSNFGKNLILPSVHKNISSSLKFNFPEKYIYSTLYNPNYVGGFFGIVLPVVIVVFIAAKKLIHKILASILCLLSFSSLIGSLSSTGLLAAIFSGIIFLIILRKQLIKNILSLCALFLCFILIVFSMNTFSEGAVFKQLNIPAISLTSIMSNLRVEENSKATGTQLNFLSLTLENDSNAVQTNATSTATTTTPENLLDIKIDKDKLFLYITKSDALVIKYDNISKGFSFTELNNKNIETKLEQKEDQQIVSFLNTKFNNFSIQLKGTVLTIQHPNCTFYVAVTSEGLKFISPSGLLTDMIKAEHFGFEGKERWGSNRGYIWSRSIPLLKNTLILGNGPDTFAIYFPQNDYVAKMKYLDNINIIVDKPHNTYLQIALNTGVGSLLAYLIFIGWYCITSVRLYRKGIEKEFFFPGVACFLAVLSFIISSIANDSTISVSVLFWIIIGSGIACNRLYAKKLIAK